MLHYPDPPLTGAGFVLRPFGLQDVEADRATIAHPTSARWLNAHSTDDPEDEVRTLEAELAAGRMLVLTIADPEDDRYLGAIVLFAREAETGELAYVVAPGAWPRARAACVAYGRPVGVQRARPAAAATSDRAGERGVPRGRSPRRVPARGHASLCVRSSRKARRRGDVLPAAGRPARRVMSNSRLVYSSGDGDQRKRREETSAPDLPRDGVVRIFRGKGGRGGKTMSVVRGLPPRELDAVAKDLKKHCGSGGTVKDGAVEIQGDHREKIAARLTAQGYVVKLAGG